MNLYLLSLRFGVYWKLFFFFYLFVQISFYPGALEECVLQPGRVYVCGCGRLLRPCRHTPLAGNANETQQRSTASFTRCTGVTFTVHTHAATFRNIYASRALFTHVVAALE